MTLLTLLVILPPSLGLIIFLIRDYRIRRILVGAAGISQGIIAVALIALCWTKLPLAVDFEAPWLEYVVPAIELGLAAYFAVAAVRRQRWITLLLAIGQAALAVFGERWTGGARVEHLIYIDQVSLLMIALVGVVGGLILLYATGYMQTYQVEYPEVKDRRRLFSFTMCVFLGAMHGLAVANDLRLMLLFWEITTWASFILIGYRDDAESRRSAFRALNFNLAGGLAFAVGVILLAARTGTAGMDGLVGLARSGPAGALVAAAPVAFIALAGLVKSAQLPFTSWLLGAMVAPTPVSALLHSSTMVKAGVFVLLRLAPALAGTVVGYLVAFIGILTFIAGAFAAVSARNAKRVLALSTVSNLGLIVACAGIGTYQLAWVACFLMLFHAVAKALLFLAVGTASVGTGSLDIEDMGALIVRMPRVALFLIVGIFAMFVAPFGMLVSKWAAMEAFINTHSLVSPLMIVLIAYGSATTVFFWTKWLGILIRMPNPNAPRGLDETKTTKPEFLAEGFLALLAVAVCVAVPLISSTAIEPYLLAVYGQVFGLNRSTAVITVLMVAMVVAVPGLLILLTRGRKDKLSTAYMSGRTADADLNFSGSRGSTVALATRSYYLEKYFAEDRILRVGVWLCLVLVLTMIGAVTL
jgi:ech hydrogenase subunit A